MMFLTIDVPDADPRTQTPFSALPEMTFTLTCVSDAPETTTPLPLFGSAAEEAALRPILFPCSRLLLDVNPSTCTPCPIAGDQISTWF